MGEMKNINKTKIQLIKDDITLLKVDAFVFYARHDLALGSGFGTAISQRGGPSIQSELGGSGTLETTQVLLTAAGELNAKHIIHAVGPRFQEENIDEKLKKTLNNVFKKAEENSIETLAFPAMGAGFYAVPLNDCAKIMCETIETYLKGDTRLKEVTICLLNNREYDAFKVQFNK